MSTTNWEVPDPGAVAPRRPVGREILIQFAKYLVVGGIAFAADFALLVALTELAHCHYLVSSAVSFTTGLVVNYLLSIVWVFDARSLSDRRAEFAVFAIVGVIGLGLTQLFLCLGTDVVRLDYRFAKILTVAIVLVWNFGARRVLLFS